MIYDPSFPPDGAEVTLTPAYIKQKAEQLRTERIVDAGFLSGKTIDLFAMKTDVVVLPVSKIIYTVNGVYTVTKAGTIQITGVAGGGGGSSCMGSAGGSGQSVCRVINVSVGDTITIVIGHGGAGNVNYANSVALPTSGTLYAGGDGENTVITLTRLLGGLTEVITLTAGTGGTCSNPSAILHQPGIGENNGGIMSMNMFVGATQSTTWNGGDGGASIFGEGGKGGTITYGGTYKSDGCDALSYGAAGGGAGFYQTGAGGSTYCWTCGGDGMQGVVILEVA